MGFQRVVTGARGGDEQLQCDLLLAGGFPGGTIATIKQMDSSRYVPLLGFDPFLKTKSSGTCSAAIFTDTSPKAPSYDAAVGKWVATALMAPVCLSTLRDG